MSHTAHFLQRLRFWKKNVITEGISQQLATGEDIDALLDRSWIRRLWTYQEIILANNPIVICGDKHIPWSVFEKSVLFLEHTCLFDARDLARPWVNAAIARNQLQASSTASVTEKTELERYVQFVYKSSQAGFKLLVWKRMGIPFLFFAMASSCLIFMLLHRSRSTKVWLGTSGAIVAGILAYGIGAAIYGLKSHRRSFEMKYTLLTEEALLTGLYSRQAKEPKDMAYGLWAVLKRSGTKGLPEPDYSIDTGDIYKTFTTHVMRMTQSMDPLLLAALKGIEGQPSWVPDWTARAVLGCRLPPRQCGKLGMKAVFPSYSDGEIALGNRPQVHFGFSNNETVLNVWGSEISHITLTACFQKTSQDYLNREKTAHLHNLRLILDYSLLGAMGKQSFGAAAGEVSAWVSFCKNHSDESLERLLKSLRTHPKIFKTHVSLCNARFHEGRAAFRARPGGSGYSCSGFCSVDAQAGDRIVCFDGLSRDLVVRPLKSSATSVKVVGLVHYFRKAMDTAHEDVEGQWTRYYIH